MKIHKLSRGKLRPIDVTTDRPLLFPVDSARIVSCPLQFLKGYYFGMGLRTRVRDCFSRITLHAAELMSHKKLF